MKVKTADLTGLALDWAVAKCEGYTDLRKNCHTFSDELVMTPPRAEYGAVALADLAISWERCGPIIERKEINLFKHNKLNESQPDVWCAHKVVPRPNMEGSFNSCALALDGPTPLIAAMRCVVTVNLGDEVDVPDELV